MTEPVIERQKRAEEAGSSSAVSATDRSAGERAGPPSGGRRTALPMLARLAGEFLVIVLGVLVALAVDEWRETRAERAREAAYYRALAEDLDRDLEEYEFSLDFLDRSVDAAEHVLAAIRGEEPADPVRPLAHSVTYASWVNYPAWTSGTVDELVNSGSIRLILDEDIKRAMLSYRDLVDEWKPRLHGPEHGTFLEYRRYKREYLPYEIAVAPDPADSPEGGVDPAVDAELARRLRGDEALRGLVQQMTGEWMTLQAILRSQRDAAADLRARIEAKLSAAGEPPR